MRNHLIVKENFFSKFFGFIKTRIQGGSAPQGFIEDAAKLGMIDQLVEEIITAYTANPDVKYLP